MSGFSPNENSSSYPHHPPPHPSSQHPEQRDQRLLHPSNHPQQYYPQEFNHEQRAVHPQLQQHFQQAQHPLIQHPPSISPPQHYQSQSPPVGYDGRPQLYDERAAVSANTQASGPAYPNRPIAPKRRRRNKDGDKDEDGDEGSNRKAARLPRACDSCSERKVKCNNTRPCQPCIDAKVICTEKREIKKRGPTNQKAEARRRAEAAEKEAAERRMFDDGSADNHAATLASLASQKLEGAELICPLPTLSILVDEFFTYIHPLAPFPHEPSFRKALENREDLTRPSFLALLASMAAVLVASFPRKPMEHLKHVFPSSMDFIERCNHIAMEARGPGYPRYRELSVDDAVTSYFLGLAAAYTQQWTEARLSFGETLTIIGVVGAHKQKEPVDFIKQEIGRRVFWVMVTGVRSLQQLDATYNELYIPPETPSNPYPPLPVEVDDCYITSDNISPQPHGIISRIVGFNLGVKIYLCVDPLAKFELCYGIDKVFNRNVQKKVLEDCLNGVKNVLNELPTELRLNTSTQPGQLESPQTYYPPAAAHSGWTQQDETPHQRYLLQLEIQKANIFASQLGTRSYIVEKYSNLQAVFNRGQSGSEPLESPRTIDRGGAPRNSDEIEVVVNIERDGIVKDLLSLLSSIEQVHMEPNGGSFISKIRQIASTLLERPEDSKGAMAIKYHEPLARFVDILMSLEHNSKASTEGGLHEDAVENELRYWTDFRAHQMKVIENGGFPNGN